MPVTVRTPRIRARGSRSRHILRGIRPCAAFPGSDAAYPDGGGRTGSDPHCRPRPLPSSGPPRPRTAHRGRPVSEGPVLGASLPRRPCCQGEPSPAGSISRRPFQTALCPRGLPFRRPSSQAAFFSGGLFLRWLRGLLHLHGGGQGPFVRRVAGELAVLLAQGPAPLDGTEVGGAA